jgi:hypothetical protein
MANELQNTIYKYDRTIQNSSVKTILINKYKEFSKRFGNKSQNIKSDYSEFFFDKNRKKYGEFNPDFMIVEQEIYDCVKRFVSGTYTDKIYGTFHTDYDKYKVFMRISIALLNLLNKRIPTSTFSKLVPSGNYTITYYAQNILYSNTIYFINEYKTRNSLTINILQEWDKDVSNTLLLTSVIMILLSCAKSLVLQDYTGLLKRPCIVNVLFLTILLEFDNVIKSEIFIELNKIKFFNTLFTTVKRFSSQIKTSTDQVNNTPIQLDDKNVVSDTNENPIANPLKIEDSTSTTPDTNNAENSNNNTAHPPTDSTKENNVLTAELTNADTKNTSEIVVSDTPSTTENTEKNQFIKSLYSAMKNIVKEKIQDITNVEYDVRVRKVYKRIRFNGLTNNTTLSDHQKKILKGVENNDNTRDYILEQLDNLTSYLTEKTGIGYEEFDKDINTYLSTLSEESMCNIFKPKLPMISAISNKLNRKNTSPTADEKCNIDTIFTTLGFTEKSLSTDDSLTNTFTKSQIYEINNKNIQTAVQIAVGSFIQPPNSGVLGSVTELFTQQQDTFIEFLKRVQGNSGERISKESTAIVNSISKIKPTIKEIKEGVNGFYNEIDNYISKKETTLTYLLQYHDKEHVDEEIMTGFIDIFTQIVDYIDTNKIIQNGVKQPNEIQVFLNDKKNTNTQVFVNFKGTITPTIEKFFAPMNQNTKDLPLSEKYRSATLYQIKQSIEHPTVNTQLENNPKNTTASTPLNQPKKKSWSLSSIPNPFNRNKKPAGGSPQPTKKKTATELLLESCFIHSSESSHNNDLSELIGKRDTVSIQFLRKALRNSMAGFYNKSEKTIVNDYMNLSQPAIQTAVESYLSEYLYIGQHSTKVKRTFNSSRLQLPNAEYIKPYGNDENTIKNHAIIKKYIDNLVSRR